jgi:hypothetical protein
VSLATRQTPATRPRATRSGLVDALASVDGLEAYNTAPAQATAGAAWPKWVQTTYDGKLDVLGRDVYEILVTLPASYAEQTVDEGDGYRDVVAFALMSDGARVTFAEPAQITFNDRQTMPGLRLRVETE